MHLDNNSQLADKKNIAHSSFIDNVNFRNYIILQFYRYLAAMGILHLIYYPAYKIISKEFSRIDAMKYIISSYTLPGLISMFAAHLVEYFIAKSRIENYADQSLYYLIYNKRYITYIVFIPGITAYIIDFINYFFYKNINNQFVFPIFSFVIQLLIIYFFYQKRDDYLQQKIIMNNLSK